MVQSAGRSNSMPSWRGYLPVRFDPTTIDQQQMITHFSQKVFLGGIPPELTEGFLFIIPSPFTSLLSFQLNCYLCCEDLANVISNGQSMIGVQSQHAWYHPLSSRHLECDGVAVLGFCHVVFRESRSVCELLKHCTRQQRSTIDYFLHIHMSPHHCHNSIWCSGSSQSAETSLYPCSSSVVSLSYKRLSICRFK